MSSSPPPFAVTPARPGENPFSPESGRAPFAPTAVSATGMKWAALHEAAEVVATLAGLDEERPSPEIRNFPVAIRDAAPWRRDAAEAAIADLAAIMAPGIAALLAVNARGADAQAPALALWQEFRTTRAAVLALVPSPGASGPSQAS